MIPVLFIVFGAVLVGASLMMIFSRHPVTSALFLVLAFCALAGIYLVLQAEFIGMVQILVYAGAIMVLFLFVIMYLNLQPDVEGGAQSGLRRVLGWLIGAVLVAEGVLVLGRHWSIGPVAQRPFVMPTGNTQALGEVLYSRYLFPFEITSIVLLVAMVGAVVIARGRGAARGDAARSRAERLSGESAAAAEAPEATGGSAARPAAERAGKEGIA